MLTLHSNQKLLVNTNYIIIQIPLKQLPWHSCWFRCHNGEVTKDQGQSPRIPTTWCEPVIWSRLLQGTSCMVRKNCWLQYDLPNVNIYFSSLESSSLCDSVSQNLCSISTIFQCCSLYAWWKALLPSQSWIHGLPPFKSNRLKIFARPQADAIWTGVCLSMDLQE